MGRLILSAPTKWHLIFHVVHYYFFFGVPTLLDVYVVFLSLTVINDSWSVELRPGILVSFQLAPFFCTIINAFLVFITLY